MASLGRGLAARGHRVTIFQLPDLRSTIEREGLEFRPIADDRMDQSLAAALAQLRTKTGLAAVRFTMQCGARLASLVCESAPQALKTSKVDFVLADQNEPAGASAAERAGLPFITVCSALPLNRDSLVPPPFLPWKYVDHKWAIIRNRMAYAMFDRVLAPTTKVVNSYRREWNLPLVSTPDDTFSRLGQLCQLTPEFDFPRRSRPDTFHYVGPFCDDARPTLPFPYERLGERPMIYASLGTLQNGKQNYFEIIAAACAHLDMQLVISTGRGVQIDESRLPGKPIVVDYAPQLEMLARATLCITHAGLNTVLESLRSGVPLVAIPITNDQPAVAARVQYCGAGECVPLSRLSAANLRNAVNKVLVTPNYRRQAACQREAMRKAGGLTKAVSIIEEVMQTLKPPVRSLSVVP
jgi:MGT family glycosyltransferase